MNKILRKIRKIFYRYQIRPGPRFGRLPNSLSIYPMIGVEGDVDEISLSLALYWRHYTNSPLNYESLWDPKKFDAKNFIGIQLAVGFEL